MNPARIEMLLKELCGRDVKLSENTAPHTFEISVSPGTSEASLDQIIKLVNEGDRHKKVSEWFLILQQQSKFGQILSRRNSLIE